MKNVGALAEGQVIKGEADWRKYRAVTLDNGVQCLLVHDGESKTTAASVCVGSGASSDPPEYSGLAHFTEHMCFLGSEKYPVENEYKRYLSCHGGRSNASTSMGHTTYKFEILAEKAEKALDIFSHFFSCPLFTESGTAREVNAVDSENSKNMSTDGRRRLQVLKALADPAHHYSKFSTGHRGTLGFDNDNDDTSLNAKQVREALLTFHKRHYRPSNMVCVVVGPQSLDTLQQWVTPRFSSIPDRWTFSNSNSQPNTEMEILINTAAADAPPNNNHHNNTPIPYNPAFHPKIQGGKWPVLLTTLPLRSMRKLVLYFPLPSVYQTPDASPTALINHLLGHEAPGSPFAVLQDFGWVDSLSAGLKISAPDQSLLQIDLSLTQLGEQEWKNVVRIIMAYCRVIANVASRACSGQDSEAVNDLKRLWGEISTIQTMNFHQTSPGSAYAAAPTLAQRVSVHGVEQCLSAGKMLNDEGTGDTLPLDDILDFALRLTPENCIVERCSKGAWEELELIQNNPDNITNTNSGNHDVDPVFGLKNEKWYGVEYHLSSIDDADVDIWKGTSDEFNSSSAVKNNTEEQKEEEENENAAVSSPSKSFEDLLHLPRPNRYLPRSLDLCDELPEEAKLGPRIEKEIDPPKLIIQKKGAGRLWHRLDDRYALPKSSLTLLLRNTIVEHTWNESDQTWTYDEDASLKSLMLTSIFQDALAQETYDASLAGLHWSLSKSSAGITLSCGGYSDRLSDLALKLLGDFLSPDGSLAIPGNPENSFLKESYFLSTKDRIIRHYKSYLQSRRADSHAMYYRDLFMSSRGFGLESSLAAAEAITLDDLRDHHQKILRHSNSDFECLYTGNVSENQAASFFNSASTLLEEAKAFESSTHPVIDSSMDVPVTSIDPKLWISGSIERKLNRGEEVELHFMSKNPEEQNGSVLVTFQSPVPGFKGNGLSSEESLKHTAAVRLICHMLREPLFDELRTKQQLGYVVSSYYNICFAMHHPTASTISNDQFTEEANVPGTTPIDSIVVNILSKKLPPTEVASRVDHFLVSFRDILASMPKSEIEDHADALSRKMTKPVQNLFGEAALHFGKIRRYGPEILLTGGKDKDLPWDSVRVMANAIKSLHRADILQVWDAVVAAKERSRITSYVYGKTFPLQSDVKQSCTKNKIPELNSGKMITSVEQLLVKRNELKLYDGSYTQLSRRIPNGILGKFGTYKTVGAAAVVILGIGLAGLALSKSEEKRNTQRNK